MVVGTLKHWTGDYSASVLVLAAVMAGGAVFAYFMLPVISPDCVLKARVDVLPPPKYTARDGTAGESDGLTDSEAVGATGSASAHAHAVQLTSLSHC